MEKDVRDMASSILTYVVNRLFELGEVELVDSIMHSAFALMPDELSKNWLKMH